MSARKRAASKSADAKPRARSLKRIPRTKRGKNTRKHLLRPSEREFAAYFCQGVAAREAARLTGLNEKNASRTLNQPLVQEYIQTMRTEIAKEDARRVSEMAHITRSEIIGGLARLAKMHPAATKGIQGQVSAYMGLAKIMGMLIDRQVNLDEFFRGWTEEELDNYASTGIVPSRFAVSEGEGAPDLPATAAPSE